MTKDASPNTKSWRNIPLAFLIGGLICTLGQLLTEAFLRQGMAKDEAAAWTSVTLVLLSALLTGLRIYDKIAKFGGAGTLVPITGFANAVVSPAIEFKSEGLILGLSGALIAFFAQWGLYQMVAKLAIQGNGLSLVTMLSYGSMSGTILAVFCAVGAVIGVGGSLVAIRKFLQV